MSKRKQQYDIEKSMEYGSIEKMHVSQRAKRMFKKPAFAPMPTNTVSTITTKKCIDAEEEK